MANDRHRQQLSFLSLLLLLVVFPAVVAVESQKMKDNNTTALSRKLLQYPGGGESNRECSKDDIVIFQGSTAPLPDGVPGFAVEILNICASGCTISDIHVSCEWFTSVRLINPRVFRRLNYDDCLVNDGQPLGPGQVLSFQYANSFEYPLCVSSVACN